MLFASLIRYLGVHELPERTQKMVQKVIFLHILIDLSFSLSSTFYVLFVIDEVGFEQLGLLIAIGMVVQAILDYPSGAMGDWIGQRWILFCSYLSYSIAFLLLVSANSFTTFLLVYCVQAFASSQNSGAIGAWFDNNYKVSAGEADPKREAYKTFVGRWTSIVYATGSISFLIGGIVATLFFRQAVFAIQAIVMFILAFLLVITIKDFPEISQRREKSQKSLRSYFRILGGGLLILFRNKSIGLFVLGMCLSSAMGIVWSRMVIFPIYYAYTGSDAGASLLRFSIWLLLIPMPFIAAYFGKNINLRWFPYLKLIYFLLFFGSFILLIIVFPIDKTSFQLPAIIIISVIYPLLNILANIAIILENRIFLDLIPDKIRNSIYSLIPTISLLIGVPAVVFAGFLFSVFNLTAVLLLCCALGIVSSFIFYLSLSSMPSGIIEQVESVPKGSYSPV